MKKYLISIISVFSILAMVSCSSVDDLVKNTVGNAKKMTFTAYQENGNSTRTAIGIKDDKTKIFWSENDKIMVFSSEGSSLCTLESGAGTTTATFSGTLSEATDYYAIYPWDGQSSFSEGKFTDAVLKSVQTATEGSFDPEVAIMVAKSNENKDLAFKNVVAYFKVTPSFDCTEIIVSSNKGDDVLAGTFEMKLDENGLPIVENISNGSNTVKLTGNISGGKTYYLAMLPCSMSNGFTVTLKSTTGIFYKQRTSTFLLARNDLWNLGELSAENMTKVDAIPYITFEATEAQTLKLNIDASGLQYSVGENGTWTDYAKDATVEFGATNGKLRLRATNPNGIFVDGVNTVFTSGTNAEIKCSGDIRTLVDYENYYMANTSNAKFKHLFRGLSTLTSAPELPISDLAEWCYTGMFMGCTSLTTAPALPAKILSNGCYHNMFYGCTALVNAPALPATSLAEYCYDNMFQGCTELTIAPSLSASELANSCYRNMFDGCTALESAPEMAATTLAEYCYMNMFNGCSALKNPPALNVMTLAPWCYYGMFEGCSALKTAPSLPATVLTSDCYSHMFSGCSALTSAPTLSAKTLAPGCYSNMFYGCSSLQNAPALEATELATFCYSWMFTNCTSLTTAPELKAETLMESCYRCIFQGCTKLSNVTMLAKDVSAKDCLYYWLDNAGTNASSRTLTLDGKGVYDDIRNGLPDLWKAISGGATVQHTSGSPITDPE